MRLGSLFSGFGLMDYGLELAGMAPAFQVENHPYAQRVLQKHWPDVVRVSDVRDAGRHNLPDCDVLAFGFPCQGNSPLGKREGLADPRSGLWGEARRVIEELRPSWLIIENSANGRKRWLGTALGDLAALGYDAEWHCLPSSAFGACHQRDRCFVVAHPNGGTQWEQSRWWGWSRGTRPVVAGLESFAWGASGTPRRPTIPRVDRAGHGVPNRLQRLRGIGNGVHVEVARFVGTCVMAAAAEAGS